MNRASRPFPDRRRGSVSFPEPPGPDGVERIRWSRVMTARARVAAGFYDRSEVRAVVADAVLRELQRD